MKHLLLLAARSAWNRRLTLGLTVLAIALSVTLLLGVERLRQDARQTFSQSVSGTDLVVGARSGAVQLMLYAVFRIGEPTNGIQWTSFRDLAALPAVAWAIPLSLGDSHRGFAVLGTTTDYFTHFRYGESRSLAFDQGRPFAGLFEAVLGADIASELGYRLEERIVLNHGMGEVSLAEHSDKPFIVTGILERTGTPVDRSVHISLASLEAIHLDWQGGAPIPGMSIPPQLVSKFDLTPKTITAALIGLKNRAAVFGVQRQVNQYKSEPLLAVLPGVALDQLWQTLGVVERAMQAVSALVVAVGLAGLVAVMLSGLNERRRELAVLRAVGARPADVFVLLTVEGLCMTLIGALAGVVALTLLSGLLAPMAQAEFGVLIQPQLLSWSELQILAVVMCAGLAASIVPGYRAYRYSLADGLSPRL